MNKNYQETQQQKKDYEKYLVPNWEDEQIFSMYYKQIELVKEYSLLWYNILEIGPWSWFVSDYLKKIWYNIDTFDYFEKFNPTYCWDIREINNIVEKKYDLIICFDVLEHIPFIDFEKTLQKLAIISNDIIIWLPRPSFNLFRFIFRLPYFKKIYKISINISLFWKEHIYDWAHHWEVWKKWYSIKIITKIFKKVFDKVVFKWHPFLFENEVYFYLKKEKNQV